MAHIEIKSIDADFGGNHYFDGGCLQKQLNMSAGIDPTCTAVDRDGDEVRIHYDGPLDADGLAVQAVVIGGHRLLVAKHQKYEAIDARTEELIVTSGFIFPPPPAPGGLCFSSSLNSQSKWHAMFNLAQQGLVQYPFNISSKLEEDFPIPNFETLVNMYATMVATGKTHFDSGKGYKDAVYAASTIAEVEAVSDNR